MISFKRELDNIRRVRGNKAFSLALSYFLENQYKDFSRDDLFQMFERSIDRWSNDPGCFSKDMGNNIKIYMLMKNLEK